MSKIFGKPFGHRETPVLMPLVSIIVRTINRPELLREALQSVAEQDYLNLELVVVNDGGDDVQDLVFSFEGFVTDIQYIPLAINRGRSAAANTGLKNAKGDYILFLDDDDLIDSDHIEYMIFYIFRNPQAKIVYAGVRTDDETQGLVFNSPYNRDLLKVHNNFPIHAVLFARKLLCTGICFDEKMEVYEDWDFWIQLSQVAEFHHLNRISATYRNKGQSAVGIGSALEEERTRARANLLDKWIRKGNGTELDRVLNALERNKAELEQQYIYLEKKYMDLEFVFLEDKKRFFNKTKDLNERIDILEKEKKEQMFEIENLKTDYNLLEKEYDRVVNSKSWKVTEPVRIFLQYLRIMISFFCNKLKI